MKPHKEQESVNSYKFTNSRRSLIYFSELGLSKKLISCLNRINFINLTPIQEKCIPLTLKGNDILASAETGSGKTGAYMIPVISLIEKSKKNKIIILVPTRELAKQILDVANLFFSKKEKFNSIILIGGESIREQTFKLKRNPKIIICTPGRAIDHLNRNSLDLKDVSTLILDETDKMLDMGFGPDIKKIIQLIPKERQTLMFSATIPKNIVKVAESYLNNPKKITIGKENNIPKNIKQEVKKVKPNEKYDELKKELMSRKGSILVFMKTKHGSDRLAKRLKDQEIISEAIHGDLSQNKRNKIIQRFRNNKFNILIGTDIVSRGLDIPHIQHVINYDLPQVPEDFIHRMGRTARAGKSGQVLTFITHENFKLWREINKLINPKSEKKNKSDDDTEFVKKRSKKDFHKKKKRIFSNGFKKNKKIGFSSKKPKQLIIS